MRRLGALVALAACSAAPPPAPAARADHAVGVVTVELEDLTRPTPANGGAPATPTRKLTTEIWYPAVGAPSDDEQAAADLDPAGKPYPLVVFVHGSSGFRRQSTFFADALARHGFVVVAADHPLTALTQPGGSSDRHAELEPGDVRFLADEVAAMAQDRTHPLSGATRPAAGYAVSGHSTGGTVALAMAFDPDRPDPRVKAVVALAPCACFFADAFFRSRATPLLVIAGSDDRYVPPATNGRRAFDLARPPKAFALLVGGDHLRFSDLDASDFDASPTTNEDDLAVSFAAWGGGSCSPAPEPGRDPELAGRDQHRLTVALTEAFLDEHLRGRPATLAGVAGPLVRLELAP